MIEANSLANSMEAIHPCDANGQRQTIGCLVKEYKIVPHFSSIQKNCK